ncbi:hypothetical protein SAMN04488094_102432 [Tropicimonas isoalkanivorans]|uniref:Uncharacterized protein n=1 Tax=Tropicimonas isoalkanivorans TaxID=441112 RepID=A0A1I1GCE0_9RHOB|nr:hypothetical protein SAMN04488094_102432 [Tropicimonas isoalkanivorans]
MRKRQTPWVSSSHPIFRHAIQQPEDCLVSLGAWGRRSPRWSAPVAAGTVRVAVTWVRACRTDWLGAAIAAAGSESPKQGTKRRGAENKRAATPGRRKVSPPTFRQPREEDGFSETGRQRTGGICGGGTREEECATACSRKPREEDGFSDPLSFARPLRDPGRAGDVECGAPGRRRVLPPKPCPREEEGDRLRMSALAGCVRCGAPGRRRVPPPKPCPREEEGCRLRMSALAGGIRGRRHQGGGRCRRLFRKPREEDGFLKLYLVCRSTGFPVLRSPDVGGNLVPGC